MNAITNRSPSACSGGRHASSLLMLRTNIHQGHATPPVHYWLEPAGSHRGWGFPAVLVWFGAAADVYWTYEPTRSGPPFTQGDSRPRDRRRTRKGLHVLCMHKIHKLRKYLVFPCNRFERMELARCLDQDGIASMAFAHARRHIRCMYASPLLLPPDKISPPLVTGKDMGQSESWA